MSIDSTAPGAETLESPRRGLELRRPAPAVVVGGLPTVSLLPREFLTAARERSLRRILVGVVGVAVLVAAGSSGLAAVVAGTAQDRLTAANVRSQSLLAQTQKFRDVQELQSNLAIGQAAVTVGSSTEIDWQSQLADIEQYMPSGFSITAITVDSASAVVDYPQGTTPLEKPRAATVQLTATTSSITNLPIWLWKLRSIPAYADATSNVSDGEDDGYTVMITLHLSPKALIDSGKAAK